MAIEKVGVVGCGIMGGGIAQVCATNGYDVVATEVDQQRLDQGLSAIRGRLERDAKRGRMSQEDFAATAGRLRGTTDLKDLSDRDLIIEAVVENMELKQSIFSQLGVIAGPEAILASNTSSLSLSALAAAGGRPEKTIGLHFFNPPSVLRLVEVIIPSSASQDTIDTAVAFCQSLERVIVRTKDTPGFIVNRLLVPFIYDAIRLVESGTATADDIDTACKAGLSHTMGPLATADLVGLDTMHNIGEAMFDETGDIRYKPPTMLRRMVSLGQLGRKSGKGFFNYAR